MSDPLLTAAEQMDWQQVVLNGGPPCFHLQSDRFCGRAQRWVGHDGMHRFVSFADLLRTALADMTKQRDEARGARLHATDKRKWAEAQRDAAQAQAAALRTQLAEVRKVREDFTAQIGQEERDKADALRTRCDELEQALRRTLASAFPSPAEQPAMARAWAAARAVLRNPSPASPAVVTSSDEPPAQARERIRQ